MDAVEQVGGVVDGGGAERAVWRGVCDGVDFVEVSLEQRGLVGTKLSEGPTGASRQREFGLVDDRRWGLEKYVGLELLYVVGDGRSVNGFGVVCDGDLRGGICRCVEVCGVAVVVENCFFLHPLVIDARIFDFVKRMRRMLCLLSEL